MSITAICGSCGRKFVAPSQFQGKRVKCKGCGEIFMIPAAGGSGGGVNPYDPDTDPLSALAAVATSDSSSMGSQQTLMERSFHDEEPEEPREVIPEARGFSSRSGITPNVLTFDYPGSSDVDQWLPIVTIVLGFLLLAASVTSPDARGIGWISFVRFLTPSLLYAGLSFPITLGMLTKASRQLRYALPPNYQLRCFASYMPAFVFLTWMQMGGEGLTIAQLFVGILGLGLSSGMVWLLFRLREEHIGTTVAYGAGGFAASVALSLALTIGFNKIGALIVTNDRAYASVPVSPFGQGLSWPTAPPAPVVAKEAPAPVAPVATEPTVVEAPTPAQTDSPSNAVGTFDPSAIPGTIDDIIDPLGTSPVVGIVRNKPNSVAIESWNTQIWQRQPGLLQLPARPEGNIVISTDGDRVAWIAEFPRLSVQIWSFAHGSVVSTIDLDRNGGHAELVGFISPDQLLIDRMPPATVAEVPVAADTPTPAAAPQPVPDEPPGPVGSTPGQNRLADALSGASDSQRAKAAAPPPPPTTPVAPPVIKPNAPVPEADGPNIHQMSVVDVISGSTVHSFILPALATDLGGGWGKAMSQTLHLGQNVAISTLNHRLVAATRTDDAITLMQFDLLTSRSLPAIAVKELDPGLCGCPTGLAYSNDGQNLAVLFENGGSALLLAYDSTTGKRTSNFVYPSGPLDGEQHGDFHGSSLIWLDPSPFWLVYGQGIISTQTGMHIRSADLNQREPSMQRMLDDDRIQIITGPGGSRHVNIMKLDRTKLESSQSGVQ